MEVSQTILKSMLSPHNLQQCIFCACAMKKKHIREYRARSLFKYVCINFNCVFFLVVLAQLIPNVQNCSNPQTPKQLLGSTKVCQLRCFENKYIS